MTQLRGWNAVDIQVGGHSFRFFNTHLEVQGAAPIQALQAAELLAAMNASTLPVVLVGDINSAADGSQTPTYNTLLAAGFRDVWNRPGDPGYTCCHAKDLGNTSPSLDQRIDVVMTRGFGAAGAPTLQASARIVGDQVGDRVRAGIWPSDHAGVVAQMQLLNTGRKR